MFRTLMPAAMAASLIFAAAPASAQNFSDGYRFLDAVRKSDGATVTEYLNRPGPSLVNTRDASSGEAALHIVTQRADPMYLRFLLQQGANPDIRDRDGNSPMMIAATLGWVEGVEVLLTYGADVNLANDRGETPLIRAVQNRNVALVRKLLESKADPDQADLLAGMSARDYAARDRRSTTIQRLLADAPKVDRQRASGPTLR